MFKITLFVLLLSCVLECAYCLDLEIFHRYLNDTLKSNAECQIQKDIFLQSLENETEWALKSK